MNINALYDGSIPSWLINSTIVFVLACTTHFILAQLFNRLTAAARKQASVWRDALLRGTQKPLLLWLWLMVLSWLVKTFQSDMPQPLFGDFTTINQVAFIVLIMWATLRILAKGEANLLAQPNKAPGNKLDPTTINALGKLLRISVLVMGILILMQLLGFSISGMLAFGGAGGLIVGYGAKDVLANFFGGLIIYMDKPFGVGDWIRSPEKEIEGTVEYIGWRHTRIRTFDKRPLYVPNATFSNIAVENPSRMENRRIKEVIGLRYEDNTRLDALLVAIREYLKNHDDIAQDKMIMVNFNSFGPSSLDFFIYCFTKTTDWATYHMIKEEVLLQILAIIHQHKADVAFPTRTLNLPDQFFE